MTVALTMLAGGAGALARYGVAGSVQRRVAGTHPWGTGVVNVIGAGLLGWLLALRAGDTMSAPTVTVLGTGFCGGFTTFSTWMVETVAIGGEGHWRRRLVALANVVGMLAVGIGVAALTRYGAG